MRRDAAVQMHRRGVSIQQVSLVLGVPYHEVYGAIYPDRARARRVFARALRRAELVAPEKCEMCGAGGDIQGHHYDYGKPLDVEWLCPGCHASRHTPSGRREADPEIARAVWCVALANQVPRAVLLETMTIEQVVRRYRDYLGLSSRDPVAEAA